MIIELGLPTRLELVAVKAGDNFVPTFVGGPNWNADTGRFNTARTGTTFSGWGGLDSGNFTDNGVLMTYTVRVTAGGTNVTTGNITARFQNAVAPGTDRPVRNGPSGITELSMSINGTTMTGTNTVNLGTVRIVP